MRNFGAFLSNLRSSSKLSLEDLAKLADTSKSTLSRLENDNIPLPFKGASRKLVITLAEILCASMKETERYLELAGINRSLLTEAEEVQLGFIPHIIADSPKEVTDLERLEYLCKEQIRHLETLEVECGISNSPRSLKLKLQQYSNTLNDIQKRLDKLNNRQDPSVLSPIQTVQTHHVATIGERLVVGHQYGEEFSAVPLSSNLYSLASPNARWLMELANIQRFAVDDCIILTKSRNFEGWEPHEIKTTIISTPLPVPDDLEKLRREKLSVVEKDYFNGPHYRLLSFTPSFSELDHLEVRLAPLDFYDYYGLNLFFDEPLLEALDGSKLSIRQKYGNTALTYSSTDRGTSLIPTPVSIQCIVVTKDQQLLLMRRSFAVAFYPNHWSASFEETMNAPNFYQNGASPASGDTDFFAGAIRGLNEEFAIPANAVESIKVLSLNVEYLTLSVDVITVIKVNLSGEEIEKNWTLKAWHDAEASKFALLSADLPAVVDKLFSRTLWHPTSRMRLIQFLFHTYGIDEVANAIEARRN